SKSPLTNDQLRVVGTLTYGGTLLVTNLSGSLAGGDRFQLFDASSTAAYFAATNLPLLNPGQTWNFNSAAGILSVVATNSTNIGWTLNGMSLTLSWPVDHIGWRLLVQTNSLSSNSW